MARMMELVCVLVLWVALHALHEAGLGRPNQDTVDLRKHAAVESTAAQREVLAVFRPGTA